VLAISASGCAHRATETIGLGASAPVEAIEPPAESTVPLDADAGVPRRDWPRVVVTVPLDPTMRLRALTRAPALAPRTPRRAGAWPTPESAASRDPRTRALAAEAVLAPALAGLDVVLLPIRAAAGAHEPDP